jgi:regulator of protease activity HflC (stomatin/prohibitin superfamily)
MSMFTDSPTLQVLELIARRQHYSVFTLHQQTDLPMGDVWKILEDLERQKMVERAKGKFQLTTDMQALAARIALRSASVAAETNQAHPVPFFGSFAEAVYWLPLPALLLLIITLNLATLAASPFNALIILVCLLTLVLYTRKSFSRVPQYENVVVFRLGNCIGAKGPGPVLVLPWLDRLTNVDLRVSHLEVPHETCITQDNVQIDVDFVLYWKVTQPVWSVTRVRDSKESMKLLSTALLRAVIAHFRFNEVLNQRESINELLKEKIDEISTDWGVYVTTVEIREIKPPSDIVLSMHLQAEAEWRRQAMVTEAQGYKEAQMKHAEGDSEALKMLYSAASLIDEKTLNLKYFETLRELGKGESTKYIFPMELTNLAQPIMRRLFAGDESKEDGEKR